MKFRRNLLLAALAAVAAAPASGQSVQGGVRTSRASGRIHGCPGLSRFHRSDFAGQSLAAGRRRQQCAAACRRLRQNPILKPEAAETVRKFGEQSKGHFGFHNPRNQCWPNGLPFVLSSNGLQIFARGDHPTMIYRVDHQVRTVRMNASHPAKLTPSWYGDSVGHFEGGTLVIDTVGIKPGPFAMIDWFGTPQTPALHVVERYRLIEYDRAKRVCSVRSKTTRCRNSTIRRWWTSITAASGCSFFSRSMIQMFSPRRGRRR